MHMLRTLSRALAIAVSAAWMFAPGAASAGSLTCTSTSLFVSPNSDGTLSVSCTDSTPPSTGTCSISVSPSTSLISTTAATVSATLTANSACGTGWAWSATGATFSSTTTNPTNISLPAVATGGTATSYTVNLAASASGTATSATRTITVNPPSSTPPPTTGAVDCTALGYATKNITIPWGAIGSGNVRVTTSGFTNGMIYVASITTPSVPIATTSTLRAKLASAESNSATGPILRTAWFSSNPTSACLFASPNPLGTYANIVGASSPNLTYQVNGTSTYYPVLKPATTYYFSIKNEYKGSPTCPAKFGSCDMYIELSKPTGW